LEFVIGKPPQALEVSGPDGQAPVMEVVTTAVLVALAPYPEARLAVAARLKEVGRVSGDDTGEPA
jgi:hypothetical protein